MISLRELLTTAQVGVNTTFRYGEYYAVAIVYYLVIVSLLTVLQGQAEKRFLWTSRTKKTNTPGSDAVAVEPVTEGAPA